MTIWYPEFITAIIPMLTCQYRKTALTIIIDISVEHFRSLKHSNTSFLSETGKCNSAFIEKYRNQTTPSQDSLNIKTEKIYVHLVLFNN